MRSTRTWMKRPPFGVVMDSQISGNHQRADDERSVLQLLYDLPLLTHNATSCLHIPGRAELAAGHLAATLYLTAGT